MRSGKCSWIEHSWRTSGRRGITGLEEVVTEATALWQQVVAEFNAKAECRFHKARQKGKKHEEAVEKSLRW